MRADFPSGSGVVATRGRISLEADARPSAGLEVEDDACFFEGKGEKLAIAFAHVAATLERSDRDDTEPSLARKIWLCPLQQGTGGTALRSINHAGT